MKAFEETTRRGRNRSIEAELVTDDDGDDDEHDSNLHSPSELVKIRYCRSSDIEILFWTTLMISLNIWVPWSLRSAELRDDRRGFFDRLVWYLRLFCLKCCVMCCCLLTEYIYMYTVNVGKIQN